MPAPLVTIEYDVKRRDLLMREFSSRDISQ